MISSYTFPDTAVNAGGKNPPVHQAHILIVEDETLVAWSLSNALRRLSFRTTIVDSGEEALNILHSTPVDLVVTDFTLPQMNGVEVAREAKRCWPNAPVVVISALEEGGSLPNLAGHPVDRFIEKPFDLFEATRIIQELVAKHSLTPSARV